MSTAPTLKKLYSEQVFPELMKLRGYKNKHEVPRLLKVKLNSGIDAEADKNQIADVQRDLALIAGQKAVLSRTRKAISNFKLKENQIVGCHVTLRGNSMWEFLYRLLAVALPTIRDFRGVSPEARRPGQLQPRHLGLHDLSGDHGREREEEHGPRHHDRHQRRDRRRGPRPAPAPRHALPPRRNQDTPSAA